MAYWLDNIMYGTIVRHKLTKERLLIMYKNPSLVCTTYTCRREDMSTVDVVGQEIEPEVDDGQD